MYRLPNPSTSTRMFYGGRLSHQAHYPYSDVLRMGLLRCEMTRCARIAILGLHSEWIWKEKCTIAERSFDVDGGRHLQPGRREMPVVSRIVKGKLPLLAQCCSLANNIHEGGLAAMLCKAVCITVKSDLSRDFGIQIRSAR